MNLSGKPRWTVVGAAAAAITIGAVGTALATGGGDDRSLPDGIRLQETVPVATATVTATQEDPGFNVVPQRVIDADDTLDGTFDSPGASPNTNSLSPDDTLDGTFDSPGDSPNTVSLSPDDTLDGTFDSPGDSPNTVSLSPDDTLDGTFDSPGDSPNTVSLSPDDSPDS